MSSIYRIGSVAWVASLALITLVAPSMSRSSEATGQKTGPIVESIDPAYDFGKVYRGETIHHTFTVRNAGGQELVISGIEKDCGCTLARIDRQSLAPGEELSVNVSVETKLLDPGVTEKKVRLTTNDPGQPETILTITGEILVTASIDPAMVELEGYKPGEAVPEQIVSIRPLEGYDLRLEKVEVGNPLLSARIIEPGKAGEYRLAVNISSETEKSVIVGTVRVFSNLEEEPILRIPVRVVIDQPFVVVPSTLSFTGVKPDFEGTLAYNVVIRNFRKEPLKILDIKSGNEFLEWKLATLEDGMKYRLTIGIKPGFPEGGFKDKVTISTNSTDYPEREVSVFVNRSRKEENTLGD